MEYSIVVVFSKKILKKTPKYTNCVLVRKKTAADRGEVKNADRQTPNKGRLMDSCSGAKENFGTLQIYCFKLEDAGGTGM